MPAAAGLNEWQRALARAVNINPAAFIKENAVEGRYFLGGFVIASMLRICLISRAFQGINIIGIDNGVRAELLIVG
jgi:hypothetical protein